jgi:hypothetical protein
MGFEEEKRRDLDAHMRSLIVGFSAGDAGDSIASEIATFVLGE